MRGESTQSKAAEEVGSWARGWVATGWAGVFRAETSLFPHEPQGRALLGITRALQGAWAECQVPALGMQGWDHGDPSKESASVLGDVAMVKPYVGNHRKATGPGGFPRSAPISPLTEHMQVSSEGPV